MCPVTAGILPIVEEEEAEGEDEEGLTTILENEDEGWRCCLYNSCHVIVIVSLLNAGCFLKFLLECEYHQDPKFL